MTDTKPKGTFAKLMSSSPTPVQQKEDPEFQKSRKQEPQQTSIPENKITGNQETTQKIPQPQNPEIQNSRKPEPQKFVKREFFTKATYRLCDEALDAIEDAKKILKRQYKIKVNLEEIAEEAILAAYKDLLNKQEKSILVTTFSGKQEIQKSSNSYSQNS
jgi:protein tyrosine/serine phosphatase